MRTIRTLAAIALAGAGCSAMANEVTIEVTNIAEARGNILVAAYDKADGWLKRTPLMTAAPAKAGSMTLRFPRLPDGDYAISVVHDLNANNRLDMNAIGIPTEPYGFSNDAVGNFGPPTFDAARVKVGPGTSKIVVNLN
jgi:uncharacterized protein (DUF2141 family)